MDHFPQRGVHRPGGNSLNLALGCIRYGWRDVAVVGAVGRDREGEALRELLAALSDLGGAF